MTDPLLRIAIRISSDEREATIARVLDLAPGGFDEIDLVDGVELGVYATAESQGPIRELFPDARVEPVRPGWEDGWRAFHRPVRVGGLWIGPPWETPPAAEPAVVIDPGRAFGTGAHPTTRLCVELLAGVPSGSLVDVGCGSGVLAIAAARLGFGPLIAVDDDPVAVEAARANARANDVAVDVRLLDAVRQPLPEADVAVANVLLQPVAAILGRLQSQIAITSGYLAGEVPAHPGWARVATQELDGWAADRFERA